MMYITEFVCPSTHNQKLDLNRSRIINRKLEQDGIIELIPLSIRFCIASFIFLVESQRFITDISA